MSAQTRRPSTLNDSFLLFHDVTLGKGKTHLDKPPIFGVPCSFSGLVIKHVLKQFVLGIATSCDPKHVSGDSWMYPYQRTPIGNSYISPT